MIVVTSEGLGRINDREGRSASGDCEGDSNKYEDFSHGRILSKKYLELYHRLAKDCDGNDKKLRRKFNCRYRMRQRNVRFWHKAESGHSSSRQQCPLLGVKRTSEECGAMSAFDPKRTLASPL